MPVLHELETYVEADPDESMQDGERAAEVRSWQYRFWMRRFPCGSEVTVASGRSTDVARRLDQLEDLFNACLLGEPHESLEGLQQALLDLFSSVTNADAGEPLGSRPFDADEFDEWIRQGIQLGFVTFEGSGG